VLTQQEGQRGQGRALATYVITHVPAERASAAETTAWPRGHRTAENTPSTAAETVFNKDEPAPDQEIRTHNTPAVPAAVRDLIRGALHVAGHINIAAGRCVTPNTTALSPSTASHGQPAMLGTHRGFCGRRECARYFRKQQLRRKGSIVAAREITKRSQSAWAQVCGSIATDRSPCFEVFVPGCDIG
jgi:hypothetical protein